MSFRSVVSYRSTVRSLRSALRSLPGPVRVLILAPVRCARWLLTGFRVGARPISAVRFARHAGFKRGFPGNHRRLVRALSAAGGLLVVAGIGGVVLHPLVPLVVLAAFVVSAAYQWWLARSSRGKSRRWPPGSIVQGPEAMMEPDYFLDAWGRHGPVFKASLFGWPMACVVGIERGTGLLRRHEADLATSPLPYNRFVPQGMLRWMDEPQHSEHRRAFAVALSSRFIQASVPNMTVSIRKGLERWEGDNRVDPFSTGPLPHLRRLVLSTWIETLLGVSDADPWFNEVCSIFGTLDILRPVPYSDAEIFERLERLEELIVASAALHRDGPDGRSDVASLAGELAAARASALRDRTVTRNLIFTALTTHDDTAGLFMWIVKFLGDHPVWLDRVRAGGEDEVIDAIVSETIRLEQSEFLVRVARRDIEFEGFVIPANWLIRICVHESHRDPGRFDDPDRFDPGRFLSGRPGRDVYAPFGVDHRSCLGEVLTRVFARLFLDQLAAFYNWEVIADGPREFSAHRHWAPSSELRVRLMPRASDTVWDPLD